jgi:hypothetical protein
MYWQEVRKEADHAVRLELARRQLGALARQREQDRQQLEERDRQIQELQQQQQQQQQQLMVDLQVWAGGAGLSAADLCKPCSPRSKQCRQAGRQAGGRAGGAGRQAGAYLSFSRGSLSGTLYTSTLSAAQGTETAGGAQLA